LLAPELFDAPEVSDEWALFQAAKWAGVAPWDLAEKPAGWLLSILSAIDVEEKVRAAVRKRHGH